jgi:hypothetical protein
MGQTMLATDAIYGALAECFITIDGNRYKFMQLTDFESKYEPNIVEIPILGQINKGHKPAGGKGTWSGTMYYNQSIMRKIMLDYQNTGVMEPFDIMVTNEDKGSKVGRQTIILKGCLLDSIILAKFVAGEDTLEEEVSGTFESFEMPEQFTPLVGME